MQLFKARDTLNAAKIGAQTGEPMWVRHADFSEDIGYGWELDCEEDEIVEAFFRVEQEAFDDPNPYARIYYYDCPIITGVRVTGAGGVVGYYCEAEFDLRYGAGKWDEIQEYYRECGAEASR